MDNNIWRGRNWLRWDPEQIQEWLRQNNLIYGGLVAIGVAMVQPFLTAGSLDLSAKISVVAFSVAIPLLAALLVINRQEVFRHRMARSPLVAGAQVVGQTCAFLGVVAGFWHIIWIAGVAMLAAGLAAVTIHSVAYVRLEVQDDEEPRGAGRTDPGSPGQGGDGPGSARPGGAADE